jgi:topoisomerase IA-like protein
MSDKADNFYKGAKYLVVLPPSSADCLNEIGYDESDTSNCQMVANNFVAWLKYGESNPSLPVGMDVPSVT